MMVSVHHELVLKGTSTFSSPGLLFAHHHRRCPDGTEFSIAYPNDSKDYPVPDARPDVVDGGRFAGPGSRHPNRRPAVFNK